MASRAERWTHARERRREQERAAVLRAGRRRRLQMLAGVVALAVLATGVGVILSSSDAHRASGTARLAAAPRSPRAQSAAAFVRKLLAGMPQHGDTLGNPHAPVTFTEYGDLECSVCDAFALDGGEDDLISKDVRSGRVELVYKSLETATQEQGSDASTIFRLQQSAAYAAGAQSRGWNYILLFYHEQGQEGTPYVTPAYLTGLARQIPGLNVDRWNIDRFNPRYAESIEREAQQYAALAIARPGTPTLIATGPRRQSEPVVYAAPYSVVARMIRSVS